MQDARSHIAGVSLGNEGTIRDWLRHGRFNVTQGKNWHRSGSVGPWLVTLDEIGDLDDLHLTTRVNGELRQDDLPATRTSGSTSRSTTSPPSSDWKPAT